MKAIQIKRLPATDFLPARIKAFTEGGKIYYQQGLSSKLEKMLGVPEGFIAGKEFATKLAENLGIRGLNL